MSTSHIFKVIGEGKRVRKNKKEKMKKKKEEEDERRTKSKYSCAIFSIVRGSMELWEYILHWNS